MINSTLRNFSRLDRLERLVDHQTIDLTWQTCDQLRGLLGNRVAGVSYAPVSSATPVTAVLPIL